MAAWPRSFFDCVRRTGEEMPLVQSHLGKFVYSINTLRAGWKRCLTGNFLACPRTFLLATANEVLAPEMDRVLKRSCGVALVSSSQCISGTRIVGVARMIVGSRQSAGLSAKPAEEKLHEERST